MLNVHFISQIIMKDNQNHCSPESSPHPDMHELQKYQRKMQASREKQILQKEITKELSVSADCHPNARRYSYRLISLLLRVFFISTTAYTVLSLFLPIPSPRTMFTNQSQLLSKVHQSLKDLSETHLIIKENTENWEKNQNVILGVDAASVNPAVTIFNDQSIKGLVNNYESKDKFFTQGSVTLQLFEEWLKNNSKLMVNSMFLFNVQPLNPNLNSFIIHIHPSNCGKGEKLIIQILNNLKDQLKKFDINTVAFAADGDSVFRPMHVQNIKDHIINNILYTSISSSQTLIISDPLHLLKRARYHLVPDTFDF